jgi:hypothetical protein
LLNGLVLGLEDHVAAHAGTFGDGLAVGGVEGDYAGAGGLGDPPSVLAGERVALDSLEF